MTAHEVLVKARNLIADEENWRPFNAVDGPFCAVGALSYETKSADWLPALDVLGAMAGDSLVYPWNDRSTHAEVVAAFDRAIAATAPEPDVSFVTEPVAVA